MEYQEPTGSLNDAQGHAGAELQIQVRISQDERSELLEAGVQVSGSLLLEMVTERGPLTGTRKPFATL